MSIVSRMKGKIAGTLFALPFFSVGVWMLWSISNTFLDAWQMRDWTPVEARVSRGGYETHSGDDSNTYEAYAEYSYYYNGQLYYGYRVSLSGGADNIGDYQQDIGRNLQNVAARDEPIYIYVDPDEPSESIIDRGIRWGLLGFKSIFLFVFGGAGLGMLIFIWRAPKEKDKTLPKYQDAPWLLNDKWQTEMIRSNSKTAMYGMLAMAAFWNLISAPLPFLIYQEVLENKNYLALIGLLFPIVGIGLIVWAVRSAREWHRFGAAPVTLDPFPGSIGGHVGGTIDLNVPFDSSLRFQLTLTNVHSYVSGSGKNRNRSEKAKWQDALIAHAEAGPRGTRLTFRFDVPDGLSDSDIERGDSYDLWRLNLHAEMPGTDLDRDYELPVYQTAQESRHVPDWAMEKARAAQNDVNDESIHKVFELHRGAGGPAFYYPMGRNLSSSIGGFIVGVIFATAGWYMIVREGMTIFGGIFGGVGALIAVATLYMMLNSLTVYRDGTDIVSLRRLLGIPISSRRVAKHEFLRLEKDSSMQSQQGTKHIKHYTIRAVENSGASIVVGESFKGEGEADAAIRLISKELGLPLPRKPDAQRDENGLLGPEVLT